MNVEGWWFVLVLQPQGPRNIHWDSKELHFIPKHTYVRESIKKKLRCRNGQVKVQTWTPLRCVSRILRELGINKYPQTSMNWARVFFFKKGGAKKQCDRLINFCRKRLLQVIVAKGGFTCCWIIECTSFSPTWFQNVSWPFWGKMTTYWYEVGIRLFVCV